LSGLGLLAAGIVFLVSTHLPLVHELNDLRAQTQWASTHAHAAAPRSVNEPGTFLLRSLPRRAEMPTVLGVLLHQAYAAHLNIDTGKYEATPLKNGGVMRYQISFPVTGPYPQVRQFIDSTLVALPAAAMTELSLTRKTIGDGVVEAQIRLTVFTRDAP
jgi:Tfp pilus assembly protein PilO